MRPYNPMRKERLIDEIGLWSMLILKLDAHRSLLRKIGLILSLAVLAVGVAFLTTKEGVLYGVVLSAMPFGVAFVLAMQRRLHLAPLLILFSAAFIPFSLPTGTGSRLVASLALAALFIFLWLLRMLIVEKRFKIERSPINAPVIAFIVVVIISIIWGAVFRDPVVYVWQTYYFVQVASALVMIVSPALLIFIPNVLQEMKYIRWLVYIMIALGAVGIFARLFSLPLPANTEGLASMWIIGLAVSMSLYNNKWSLPVRGLLILLALLWVYYGFVRNISWVAGWLPGMVAGAVILFFRSKRLLLIAATVLVLYVTINSSLIDTWLGDEREISGETRLMAWRINWKFTSQHLLFGMGPAGYAAYYMTYYPSGGMATHSNYIDILAQVGVVGTAFYLAIFFVLGWRGYVVYQRVKGRRDFLEALIVALLGGVAGCVVIMGFGDWLLPFAYTQTIMGFSYTVYSWLFMGLILSLDIMTARWIKQSGSLAKVDIDAIDTPKKEAAS